VLGNGQHLVGRVQHIDTLGVGVVVHIEWSIQRGSKVTQLLLGILERLGNIVHRLERCDGVGLNCSLGRVEWAQLWLVGKTILELAKRRQQTSAKGLDTRAFTAQSKLDCEPVALDCTQAPAPIVSTASSCNLQLCGCNVAPPKHTVARRLISSSEAPSDAKPISCEKSANAGSQNSGTWPRSSWHTSLSKQARSTESKSSRQSGQ
jgi:hypothetical protein